MFSSARHYVLAILLLVTMLFAPAIAVASVTDEVKTVVDQVVSIVSDKEMKKPKNEGKRRAALDKTISTIFDYNEMAKLSLGVHWRDRSAAERQEFVKLFKTLLENSYADKIESYNNEKISYLKESVEGDSAEVKSKIVTAKREEFTIDYRLKKDGAKWMVCDVVIEGVSLVANYRSQFNRIVRGQGYAALVKKLKDKSAEIKGV
ncbi:MAG TPA: ABC transporter substrate-binding protein [Geobacteraceae bacterium]|nr:ABC transporter substrate-binding protein [Geobacteraceae bacterium]